MLHVEDRHPGAPRPLKQTSDALEYFFAMIEWATKGKHALLNVDDHQTRG
jgi:hypothetical protein